METFGEWLLHEMALHGINSLSEMGRRCGVTHAAISKVINGENKASAKLCRSIARAFGIPPVDVFRRAGLLPPAPDADHPQLQVALFLFDQLSDADKKRILVIMKALGELSKGGEKEGSRTESSCAK